MQNNGLKLMPVLALVGGLLSACSGDEVGSDDAPAPILPDIIQAKGTEISIQNTPLPIIENFDAASTSVFFDPSYKSLATPATNEVTRDGSAFTLTDPWPSFFFPNAGGFFDVVEDTGEILYATPEETDPFALRVGNGKMAISDTRFSIGQILSDLIQPGDNEPKDRNTGTVAGSSLLLGSWGELDLFNAPYRVSFCLADFGATAAGNSNLELWVDNNQSGQSNRSIHAVASRLLRTAITGGETVVRGNRVVVDVPGDAYMVDNDGNRLEAAGTLGVIQPLDGRELPVGTETSFLQLRVSSGGYAVIDDLIIELQTDNNAAGLVCEPDLEYWTSVEVPISAEPAIVQREFYDIGGETFADLPLTVDASIGEIEFFAQVDGEALVDEVTDTSTTGAYLAISDNEFDAFFKEEGSSNRIFVNAEENAVHFGQARWSMGRKNGSSDNCADHGFYDGNGGGCPGGTPNGNIDLSQPYRISMQVKQLPLPAGPLQIFVDNFTSNPVNSVHGRVSELAKLTFATGLSATGELVINVPGDILLNGSAIGVVAEHVGTTTSFIGVRCDSSCGPALEEMENGMGTGVITGGIILGDFVVEAQ